MSASQSQAQPEVPAHVFDEFLIDLKKADVQPDVIDRLRKTIIIDKNLSEKAVRAALFSEDETND